MMHGDAERRLTKRPALLSLLAVLSLLAGLGGSAALAQSIMRSPSLNFSSRVPSIDRSMPHIDPNLAGRGVTGLGNNIRFQPSCTAADRDSGNCSGDVTTSSNIRKNGKKR